MANVGEDVQSELSGPFRKGYDLVRKYLGDPEERVPQKAQKMNWKPEPNAEQQKYLNEHGYGQKKLADRKPLGSKKTAKKSVKKPTARKR